MPAPARILWTNAVTLGSVAVLVGTELVGAGGAAGWAIGGLFQLGDVLTHVLEGLLILFALTGLYFFLRAALAHEPVRGEGLKTRPPTVSRSARTPTHRWRQVPDPV